MIPSLGNKSRNQKKSGCQQLIKKIICDGVAYPSFNQIPQGYSDLLLVILMRSTTASTNQPLRIRFNNDTGSNYNFQISEASNASASASNLNNTTSGFVGNLSGSSNSALLLTPIKVEIYNYASKTFQIAFQSWAGNSQSGYNDSVYVGSSWKGTQISSIQFFDGSGGVPVAGSIFRLYGIL